MSDITEHVKVMQVDNCFYRSGEHPERPEIYKEFTSIRGNKKMSCRNDFYQCKFHLGEYGEITVEYYSEGLYETPTKNIVSFYPKAIDRISWEVENLI